MPFYPYNYVYKDTKRDIFILYTPFNRHYKKAILSLLLSRFTIHFVFVIEIVSHFLSRQSSLQHKKKRYFRPFKPVENPLS